MRLPRLGGNTSFITCAISLLLISHVAAQGALPTLTDELGGAATTDGKGAAKTDAAKTDTAAATDAKKTDAAKTTDAAAAKTTGKAAKTTDAAAKTTDSAALSGLPKLAEDRYPAPTVPPTAGAPFMQKSNLPEGTVFICVGAALGFIGMMVLAWRGFMAWSLHRSVRKAAIASTAKYAGRDPLMGFKNSKGPYMHSGPGSTLSLDQLGGGGGRKHGGGKTNSAHSNLFFSPTAGAGMNTPSNRASGYLPSGYYASGNAAPASGASMTHIGGGVPMSNLSNQNRYSGLGPRGHSPSRPPSPPSSRGGDSLFNGSRLSTPGLMGQPSTSSLNLNVAPQGRAPSAYLDDLFENHAPVQAPADDRRNSRRH